MPTSKPYSPASAPRPMGTTNAVGASTTTGSRRRNSRPPGEGRRTTAMSPSTGASISEPVTSTRIAAAVGIAIVVTGVCQYRLSSPDAYPTRPTRPMAPAPRSGICAATRTVRRRLSSPSSPIAASTSAMHAPSDIRPAAPIGENRSSKRSSSIPSERERRCSTIVAVATTAAANSSTVRSRW